MFFIKLTFWLGLVVLLLPTDQQQQARLYTTAVATVERVATFCDRNAKTCTLAAEGWATFVKKAEFGARLVGDLVSTGARERGADMAPQAPSAGGGQVRGTLSPTDMEPAWRGPPARRVGI